VSEHEVSGGSWGKHLVSQLPWVLAMLIAGILAFTRLEARYETLTYRLASLERNVSKLQSDQDQGLRQELELLRGEVRKSRLAR
jgi:hypothetical protein